MEKIFDDFDAQGEGAVDFSELASGLSILCGGERGDKVEAAFSLFDFDGNGYITLEEMATYLHSVFRMLYEVSPETRANMGVQPDELAMATALQCFEDADLNGDEMLSFDEFKRWYTRPTEMGPGEPENADDDDGTDDPSPRGRKGGPQRGMRDRRDPPAGGSGPSSGPAPSSRKRPRAWRQGTRR